MEMNPRSRWDQDRSDRIDVKLHMIADPERISPHIICDEDTLGVLFDGYTEKSMLRNNSDRSPQNHTNLVN